MKIVIIPILAIISVTFFSGCSGTRPAQVGEGVLALCPKTPNCVSTHATDSTHAIAPFTYTIPKDQAMAALVAAIDSMPRTMHVAQLDNYLYVEFTSLVWRFVDDVEFVFDDSTKTIHFRSASRLGKGDAGVNRKRMEEVRRLFNESMKNMGAIPELSPQPPNDNPERPAPTNDEIR